MGEHPQTRPVDARQQPVRPQSGQLAIGCFVLHSDTTGGLEHGVPALVDEPADLVDTPREIDGGGPRRSDPVDCLQHLVGGPAALGALVQRGDNAHRTSHAERGSTPHGQDRDGIHQCIDGLDVEVNALPGQLGLVEQAKPVGRRVPLNGTHGHDANPTASGLSPRSGAQWRDATKGVLVSRDHAATHRRRRITPVQRGCMGGPQRNQVPTSTSCISPETCRCWASAPATTSIPYGGGTGHLGAKAPAHAVDPDLTVTTSCQKGFASKALVRASTGTAGIVLGTNGHGTLSRASVGAVAQQVATYAKCPVAVIPRESPAQAEHGAVVVGVDTSTTARRALQRAFDHAVVRGCALQVVHAWNPRGADNPARGQSDSWDAYAKEFEAIVDQTLESSRREHPRTDVAVEVVKGDPRRVLADRSADADLVVPGARGDGGFHGMHIGRVALHLMGHSASPVILVR